MSPDQLVPYNLMADHWASSQQANPISTNTYPHPDLHWLHGQNPHKARDDQQGVHQEGVLEQMGNMVMQAEMQHPQHRDINAAIHYNAASYNPPLPQYPEVPHMHMHWNVRHAETVPAQAHPLGPVCRAPPLQVYIQLNDLVQEHEVHENCDGLYGYGAHVPTASAGPPDIFPAVWQHPAPPENGLRNLAGRFLNNPDMHVIMLRIESGPRGHFVVQIMLNLADLF
ncbi:hypothetical protein EI94DRAFT_1815862 [Lactarius quietus]|nr:hypothetical protein EI94DRAFT_1815862 [Lactarius quietus]